MRINRDTVPETAADRLATVTLQPRHWRAGEHLPPLTVTPPRRGGWTLERAAKAARDYAREHHLGRPGALRALKTIEAHAAPGLGVDYQRDRFQSRRDLLDPSRP